MRKINDIYKDYLNWMYEHSGNHEYKPEFYLDSNLPKEELDARKAALYKAILELCYNEKNGLFYFAKFIIGDLTEIGYPKPFRFNGLLREWDKLVKSYKKLAILCARGHGKSVFFSEMLNLYDMFLFKHRRVIIISASQEQANHLLDEIKTIIENNEWLSKKKDPNRWASTNIGYNGGYILVAGMGSEILGQHVDRIVLDDVLRDDNKLTDEQVEDYVDMKLDPMLLNRDGQMVLVGTPKRETDIFSVIFERVKEDSNCPWKLYKFPAVIDYENKTLQCPDRFTWQSIMNKRLSMGPLKFAREYQLEFFSREHSLFPAELIEPAKNKGKDKKLLRIFENFGPQWSFVGGIDVARSGSASADYTVVTILGYNSVNQEKRIIHVWREKGLKITEQARQIAELSKKFKHPMFLVEQNNIGQDMIDTLVDEYNVGVEAYKTTHRSKDEMIRFLVTAFEYEQIVMPRGDRWSRDITDEMEYELQKFSVTHTPAGNEKYEGLGAHDDMVMSLALANKATQEFGVPFAITNFDGDTGGEYDAFTKSSNKGETDLVNKIRMGIIR